MVIIYREDKDGNVIRFFQDGYLDKQLAVFKNAIEKHNTSAVIVIDGRSGMGKTTLANQVAKTLDKNYDLEKIFYNPDDFLAALKTAKKGDCLTFDEAMLISSRSALSAINKMIVMAMSMIRSKKLYIIFCVNSIFDLDKNLAISRADLLLHVYGQSLIDRGKFCAYFKAKDGNDRIKQLYLLGKKLYSYSRPKANYRGRFPKEFVVNEKEYEIRKQKGVNSFLGKTAGTRTVNAYQTRNAAVRALGDMGLTPQEVAKKTGLSLNIVYKINEKLNKLDEFA